MATQLKAVEYPQTGSQLCAAMAQAFPEIEGATKEKNNPAFKSKYADLSSVIEAIKPAIVKHGLFFSQNTHDVEGGVCIETILFHASGESMSFGKLFVPATKHDAQGYGSALTYARRYSLMSAFGVAPEDDDGNAAAKTAPAREVGCETATPRSKPAPLKGPYTTRAEVKAAYAEAVREMHSANDDDTLDAYLITQEAFFAQLRNELPHLWNGDGADFIGMDAEIKAARIAVMEPTNYVNAG